jgi:predicted small metal-binding protein
LDFNIFFEHIKNNHKLYTTTCNLSIEALNKIIPELLFSDNGDNLSNLIERNIFDTEETEGSNDKIIEDLINDILSPTVKKSVKMFCKVFNLYIKQFSKNEIDTITIETTRDRNSCEEKRSIVKFQKQNKEIKDLIGDNLKLAADKVTLKHTL